MAENYRARILSRTRLDIDGYLYVRSYERKESTYWDCKKLRDGECKARAVTTKNPLGGVVVSKGWRESPHRHAPSRDVAEAEKIKADIKKRSEEDEQAKPSVIIRGIELTTCNFYEQNFLKIL